MEEWMPLVRIIIIAIIFLIVIKGLRRITNK